MTTEKREQERAATVSRKDRDRMASDLHDLGLYATSRFVRKGKISLTHGVEHVRHYVLPGIERGVAAQIAHERKYPPIPGTWGAVALEGIEKRRDQLQAFLNDWFAYDMETTNDPA